MKRKKAFARKLALIGGATAVVAISVALFFVWKQGNSNPNYQPNFDEPDQKEIADLPYGVSSDNPEATKVGMDIMEQGGNAIDAAIAVSYVLSVTDVYSSGLGGGGMMLIDSPQMEPDFYDYQVSAPQQEDFSSKDIGVPGLVAGMEKVHDDYGSLPMEDLIQPAVDIAEDGFEINETLHNRLSAADARMPVGQLPNFYPEGRAIETGETLKQEKLADTLRSIQEEGADALYQGEVGEQITSAVDGLDMQDLDAYEVRKKEPVKGKFAGFDVYSPGAPGGGIPLIQSLELAEEVDVASEEDQSLDFIKLMGSINQQIYEDKIHNIGDPDYADVATDELISKEHIEDMADKVDKSPQYEEKDTAADEDDEDGNTNTAHFVVVDEDGMMVSSTNTLSNFFGSGKRVAGVFLNNELRIFSDRESSPNYAEPGKRPASYIAPTILSKDGAPIIGIGSAGGGRIPNVISQVLLRMLEFDKNPQDAVSEPRAVMNYKNGAVSVEKDYPDRNEIFETMNSEGYPIDYTRSKSSVYFGSVQSLIVDYEKEQIVGGSDPRREGEWLSD